MGNKAGRGEEGEEEHDIRYAQATPMALRRERYAKKCALR
jgi:hypothetical protein